MSIANTKYVCKPFYLYRDDEHEKHLHVRVQRRKAEEHGKEHVVGAYHIAYAGRKEHDKAVHGGQEHAAYEEDVESRRSPLSFKSASYPIIKIEENKLPYAQGLRYEHEGDKSPYLSFQDETRIA